MNPFFRHKISVPDPKKNAPPPKASLDSLAKSFSQDLLNVHSWFRRFFSYENDYFCADIDIVAPSIMYNYNEHYRLLSMYVPLEAIIPVKHLGVGAFGAVTLGDVQQHIANSENDDSARTEFNDIISEHPHVAVKQVDLFEMCQMNQAFRVIRELRAFQLVAQAKSTGRYPGSRFIVGFLGSYARSDIGPSLIQLDGTYSNAQNISTPKAVRSGNIRQGICRNCEHSKFHYGYILLEACWGTLRDLVTRIGDAGMYVPVHDSSQCSNKDKSSTKPYAQILPTSVLNELPSSAALPVPLARYYIACILEGLAFLHNLGLVHRDIQLSNVGISTTGEVRLLDLGFTRFLGFEGEYPLHALDIDCEASDAGISPVHTNASIQASSSVLSPSKHCGSSVIIASTDDTTAALNSDTGSSLRTLQCCNCRCMVHRPSELLFPHLHRFHTLSECIVHLEKLNAKQTQGRTRSNTAQDTPVLSPKYHATASPTQALAPFRGRSRTLSRDFDFLSGLKLDNLEATDGGSPRETSQGSPLPILSPLSTGTLSNTILTAQSFVRKMSAFETGQQLPTIDSETSDVELDSEFSSVCSDSSDTSPPSPSITSQPESRHATQTSSSDVASRPAPPSIRTFSAFRQDIELPDTPQTAGTARKYTSGCHTLTLSASTDGSNFAFENTDPTNVCSTSRPGPGSAPHTEPNPAYISPPSNAIPRSTPPPVPRAVSAATTTTVDPQGVFSYRPRANSVVGYPPSMAPEVVAGSSNTPGTPSVPSTPRETASIGKPTVASIPSIVKGLDGSILGPATARDRGASLIHDLRELQSYNLNKEAYETPPVLASGHDFAADVWSFGVLCYELLIGISPFSKLPSIYSNGMDFEEYQEAEQVRRSEAMQNGEEYVPAPYYPPPSADVLNRRIQDGDYQIPVYFEENYPVAADFLRCCLHVDPSTRFTMDQLRMHPFFSETLSLLLPSDLQGRISIVQEHKKIGSNDAHATDSEADSTAGDVDQSANRKSKPIQWQSLSKYCEPISWESLSSGTCPIPWVPEPHEEVCSDTQSNSPVVLGKDGKSFENNSNAMQSLKSAQPQAFGYGTQNWLQFVADASKAIESSQGGDPFYDGFDVPSDYDAQSSLDVDHTDTAKYCSNCGMTCYPEYDTVLDAIPSPQQCPEEASQIDISKVSAYRDLSNTKFLTTGKPIIDELMLEFTLAGTLI